MSDQQENTQETGSDQPDLSKYYSTADVAELLGCSVENVGRMVRTGKLQPDITGLGVNRKGYGFSRETIDAFVEQRMQERMPKPTVSTRIPKEELRERVMDDLAQKVLNEFGTDALDRTYQPTVKWSVDRSSPTSPGTPMLMLSDVHHGEVVHPDQVFSVNEFNRAICERRVKNTFEKAATLLLQHMANPDYPGIVLILGGDLISGSLHEDALMTDENTPIEQSLEVAQIVSDGIAFLSKEFKNVDVRCVPGNHGRTTRRPYAKMYAATNLDWMAYQIIKRDCKDMANVSVECPPVVDMTFKVANRRYRLTHGDQFRGGDGIIGCLGPIIRGDVKKRANANLMPTDAHEYDTLLVGHFHQLIQMSRLIVNGSVKGYDEFALRCNLPFEVPQQALWITHPDHGINYSMPVLCEDESPMQRDTSSTAPTLGFTGA